MLSPLHLRPRAKGLIASALPLTSLTPLAAHEHGTGRVPRPIIAFPTPQKVVPEDSCALGENELSVCILNTSYKDLFQESRAIHPSAEMPLLFCV